MGSAAPPKYWFHAKRYGWGWGLPARWQGWVTLVVWLAVTLTGAPFLALRNVTASVVFIVAMTAVLIAICWAKGEPPRWRWG